MTANKFSKTPYSVCVGTHNLYPIYRIVWAYKGHFYVKYKSEKINVDRYMDEHNFVLTETIKRNGI